MANETLLRAAGLTDFQQGLKQVLAQAANATRPQTAGLEGASVLTTEIERLRATSGQQAEAVLQNTQAVLQNTVLSVTGSSGPATGTAAKWALGMATGGLAPLTSGLIGLFRGGDKQEPAPLLVSYARPQTAALEGLATQDRGTEWNWRDGIQPSGAQAGAVTQHVTVQVQAMDSKSFLDHRDDIARAVRQAVLNSHSLNDALAEL
ncbi:MAG TPA: hypothetical protein VN428_06710 [Bryobacteraceae bacterium]|nr:hypothetical protein [Bryobacteraceae bacterium]